MTTLDEARALPPSARFRVEWACLGNSPLIWHPATKPQEVAGWQQEGWDYNINGPSLNLYQGEAVAFSPGGHVLVLGNDGSVQVFPCSRLRVVRPPVREIG